MSRKSAVIASLAGLLLGPALGCETSGKQDPNPRAQKKSALERSVSVLRYRTISYSPRGWRVQVPSAGYLIHHRTFTGSPSPSKIKETLTLLAEGRAAAVAVDVWVNPERLPLAAWFDRHLGYLTRYGGTVTRTSGTGRETEVWFVEQAASPQAHSRKTAVFAVSGLVFRVTCLNAETSEWREIFHQMVRTLRVPEVRP